MSIVSTSNRYCMPEILELKATTILSHRSFIFHNRDEDPSENAQNFYKACFVSSFTSNVQIESHEILEIDYCVNFPYSKILRPLLSRQITVQYRK